MSKTKYIKQNKWLAAFLSLVIPGLGQWYNGDFMRGAKFFVGITILSILGNVGGNWVGLTTTSLLFTIIALAVDLYCIWDAYQDNQS